MSELTSRERFGRMFNHKEADRVPMLGAPWGSTMERWRREGMPEGVHFADYFDIDHVIGIGADNSPQYPERVVEETEEYVIRTTKWGVTQRNWRHAASTPEFLDYTTLAFQYPQRAGGMESEIFTYSAGNYSSDNLGIGIIGKKGRNAVFFLLQETPSYLPGGSTFFQAGWGIG